MTRHDHPPPEACGNCRFYGGDLAAGWGACRKRAPVATEPHEGLLRGWPIVYIDDDWCGDYQRDASERGLGPATSAEPKTPPGPPPGFPDLASLAGRTFDPPEVLIRNDLVG